MYKVKVLYILLGVTGMLFSAKGQNGNLMPDTYTQFFQNYYLVNPANTDTSQIILNIGHKSQTGIFQGVRQTYFDANVRIKSRNLNRRQYAGIQAFNNSEGDYFSRNRVYGRYSFDVALTPAYYLSAGASLGAVNYAFKATQSSAGGSDIAYDGALGLWLVGSRFKIGASIQQLFQKTVAPIGQEFVLRRVYNMNAVYVLRINYLTQLTFHGWYRYQRYSSSDLQLAAIFTLQNLIEFGANYRYQKGLVIMAGLKNIPVGTSSITIAMSYSTGILNYIARGDNGVEIFLRYSK